MIRTIVAATDFNLLATAAVRLAAAIARAAGAELVVVYADTFDPPAEFTASQVDRMLRSIERARQEAKEELANYVSRNLSPGLRVRTVVVEGTPADAIVGVARREGAGLVVMGTHGRGGLQRLMVGSVAERVIRESPVPVLTVRSAEAALAMRRIVCAVNGSEAARHALEHARAIASATGAELTLLHIADETTFVPESLARSGELTRIIPNHPAANDADEILTATDDAGYDLIVIGAEHKRLRDVTIFGSTTSRVTRHARTPVLTVIGHGPGIVDPATAEATGSAV